MSQVSNNVMQRNNNVITRIKHYIDTVTTHCMIIMRHPPSLLPLSLPLHPTFPSNNCCPLVSNKGSR